MSNVCHSGLDESEIDCMLDNTVLILLSGEDSGCFVDCDASHHYHIQIMMRFSGLIRERMKVKLNFLNSGKG